MIKENIFGGRRRFTTTEPTDYRIRKISVHEFARATEKFLSEGFRGAIDVKITSETAGYVEISVYGFAYLVKLVLSKVYGNRVLSARMDFTKERISFSVDFGADADEDDVADTVRAGEKCGLICQKDKTRLNFYAETKQSPTVSLYARDGIYSLSVYNEVFFI